MPSDTVAAARPEPLADRAPGGPGWPSSPNSKMASRYSLEAGFNSLRSGDLGLIETILLGAGPQELWLTAPHG